MSSDLQRYRSLASRLPARLSQRRVVVLTGARQVGKTTLARSLYPDLHYINLDAVEDREALRAVRAAAWGRTVGDAILDEAQKAPEVFEKVKYAFDASAIDFSVLTGSSRMLLLERVRETLAGRAFVFELWPLMLSELLAPASAPPPSPPLLDALLDASAAGLVLADAASTLWGDAAAIRHEALDHLLRWGGMPELGRLSDADRTEWLRSYQITYLERDLADLASLADLTPFRTLQRLVMLRSGQLLSFAELGRDAGISAPTARRYLEYLRLTYQAVLLPPYHRNLTSAVVKTPKVYWVDAGLLRHVTGQHGPPTGAQFETCAIVEIHKWIATSGRLCSTSFYRTRGGLEVDLLIETPHGVIGVEVKQRAEPAARDIRGLAAIADALGDRWVGGLVVTSGGHIAPLDPSRDIWSIPLDRLLSAPR